MLILIQSTLVYHDDYSNTLNLLSPTPHHTHQNVKLQKKKIENAEKTLKKFAGEKHYTWSYISEKKNGVPAKKKKKTMISP